LRVAQARDVGRRHERLVHHEQNSAFRAAPHGQAEISVWTQLNTGLSRGGTSC
jgi:hypothetical protein